MKRFKVTFYFEDEKQCVETTAEQLGVNFALVKMMEDLADGTNTHVDVNKPLAEYQNSFEHFGKTLEFSMQVEDNDIKWEHDGKKYRLVIFPSDTTNILIFDEEYGLICSTRYFLTPIED